MGKHAKKRQRTAKDKEETPAPLGSRKFLEDDAEKDDEERRLESLLFGVPYTPGDDSGKLSKNILILDEDERENEWDDGAKEMEGLQDADVGSCFLHTAAHKPGIVILYR